MANAYDIAIRLSMANGVSPVLATIAKEMLGLEMSAKSLEKTLGRIGTGLKLMVGGGSSIMGGVEMIKALEKIADMGSELSHQQNMMVRSGVEYNQVLGVTKKAFDDITKAVPSSTAPEVLRTITELKSVLGDVDKAMDAAPGALKIDALLRNMSGHSSSEADSSEGFKIWRALEMKKGMPMSDPKGAIALREAMLQDIIGSGGKIDASAYQNFAKRGGEMYANASPEFIAGPASVVIGDLGGETAGTAMQTFFQLITGATQMSRQQYDVLDKAGLIDESKVKKIKGSSNMQMAPGAVKGAMEHMDNLFAWANEIAPALHAQAAKLSAKSHGKITEEQEFNAMIAKLGRNRNTARMLDMFTSPEFRMQIDKDIQLWRLAQGGDQAYATAYGVVNTTPKGMEDPAQARERSQRDAAHPDYKATMEALTKQWDNLWEAVGGPVAAAAIPVLKKLTDLFNTMASWANAHQELTTLLAQIAGITSVALIAGGSLAVLAGSIVLLRLASGGFRGGIPAVPGGGGGGGAGPQAASGLGIMGRTLGAVGGALGLLWNAPDTIEGIGQQQADFNNWFNSTTIGKVLNHYAGSLAPTIAPVIPSAPSAPQSMMGPSLPNTRNFLGRDPRSPSTGPYSYNPASAAMQRIGADIQGSLQAIPGQVQPAINNLSTIGAAISAAINGIAASARGAAGAIRSGGAGQAVTVRTTLDVSGRTLAEVVSGHQMDAARTASNGGIFDGSSMPTPPDLSYSFG